MTIKVSSTAFAHGERIPARHTGEGQDVSPCLSWSQPPEGTAEVCILCEDPDAPRRDPWVHWMVAGLDPAVTELEEGATRELVQGRNDFGDDAWGGPMPPKGHGTHHYVFRVMALARPSGLHRGFGRHDLLRATKGRILDEGELVGTYERR